MGGQVSTLCGCKAGGVEIFWLSCFLETPREYIICVLPFVGSRCTRGCRTLWCSRVRFLTFPRLVFFLCAILCGAFTGAAIFISLPSVVTGAAVSWDGSRAEPFRKDIGPGPFAIPISIDRLCGDAGARACGGERTEEGESVESVAGAETKSFAFAV